MSGRLDARRGAANTTPPATAPGTTMRRAAASALTGWYWLGFSSRMGQVTPLPSVYLSADALDYFRSKLDYTNRLGCPSTRADEKVSTPLRYHGDGACSLPTSRCVVLLSRWSSRSHTATSSA